MTIHYELIIYWSEVDRVFIAEVPELSGCVADGETYQEAVQNVEVVFRRLSLSDGGLNPRRAIATSARSELTR